MGTLLILLAMVIQLITSCPSSCLVCSENVTLCQGLTYIPAAPVTTKALIVTDGNITSVESFNLSLLFNVTLLRLSSNRITDIKENAFNGLRDLRTLLLDQNQISSSSISDNSFSELRKLQVLVLSNNALRNIYGIWFKNTKDLMRLQLNGNQITNLMDSSFGTACLHRLRTLDLSNNFISYIEKNAFQHLPQLKEMDLSRNRLALIPDMFSHLPQLILLSLDQNQWNCTCKLCDLAFFLRSYVNSSTRLLKNANDTNCRASKNPAVHNVLDLTEANCNSDSQNFTAVLKNKTMNSYWRDVTLVALFCFVGAVGLTCLVLALLNWKLQQGKANEHTSENCCCRTLDESQCGHEPRNYLTEGACNCHLTQENEIKVTSIVGSGREMPLLQENRHRATVKADALSVGLDAPLRSIQRENEYKKSGSFLCLKCRMVESCPQEPYETMSITNEEGALTKDFHRSITKPSSFDQWEYLQTTVLQELSKTDKGIKQDTFSRRCATPTPALAKERLEKHLTNESCQSPPEAEDNCLKSHRQTYFITSSSAAPNTSVESKEHCVQKILQSHRSQHDDQCGLLERSKNISLQLHNSLICKYVNCDKFQGYTKEKKENHRENLKLEKEQTKTNRRVGEDCFMSDEEMPLSPEVKKRYISKSVSFYVPDLATVNRLDETMMDSTEVGSHKKNVQRNQAITLESREHSNSETRSEGGKLSSAKGDIGRKTWLRKDEANWKSKMKTKGQDFLTVKLNLHPFRKVRIHPEKSPCSEKTQQKSNHQHKEPPIESKKKLSQASNKELTRKERKSNQGSSVVPQNHPGTREQKEIYSKKVVSQFSDKQTLAKSKNAKSEAIITSTDAAELSEEKCNNPIVSVPQPFKNIYDVRNSKDLTSVLAEAVMYNSNLPPPSKETARSITPTVCLATQNLASISQNGGKDISISLYPREVKGDDTGATESYGYQNSQMTTRKEKDWDSSSALIIQTQITGNLQTKNPSSECDLELKSVMEDTVKNVNQGQMDNRIPPNINPISTETYFIPKQSSTEPPNRISSLLLYTEASEHLTRSSKDGTDSTDNPHGTGNTEDDGVKIEQRENKQPPNDSESLAEVLTPDTQMNSDGLAEDIPQTQNDVESEKCKLFCTSTVKVSIMSNTSSIPSSPKTRNIIPCSDINFQTNNNRHMKNVQNLQHIQNNQPDEDNNIHEEGEMPLGEHKEPSMLPELKDISFEAENEVPLIPSRINDAENSAPKVTLYPPSANTSPLESEQSEENNSNNNHIPLLLSSKLQTNNPSLSENSKFIIVAENLNKSMNITQYLIDCDEKNARPTN
ncbi:LOW QUALITY PROTEIN: leucine-rich repeat-containing protein 53 [Chelonoidis abingdonii]|uniref:LOW QUALITY PROTEIN: leucine-rich repeat-containing protein 53 n=1 Tax=Chelonoidis abingdonii TaxID=106734 RepID=UPI003F499582